MPFYEYGCERIHQVSRICERVSKGLEVNRECVQGFKRPELGSPSTVFFCLSAGELV